MWDYFLKKLLGNKASNASLIFFTFVSITVITLVWLIPTIKNVRSSASILALEAADRLRSTLQLGLENSQNNVEAMAGQIAAEPTRRSTTVEWFLKDHPDVRHIAIIERSGVESLRIEQGGARSSTADHARNPIYYLALQGVPNFSSVQSDPTGGLYTTLAVPLVLGSTTQAVIIAEIDINSLQPGGFASSFRARRYVVDREGRIILSSDPNVLPLREDVLARPIVQKVVVDGRPANGLAADDAYTEDGEKMFAVGLPIALTGWGVFVEQSASVAFAGERVIILFAMVAWILGVGLAFFVVYGNYRLNRANARLSELLKENDQVGKILVRRDIELTEANARLTALDENKSEFVSIAAHQLQTPVTGIRWSLASLMQGELGSLTDMQRKIVKEALDITIRMIDLVHDLLNVARIEEGRFDLRFKEMSLELLIGAALERCKASAAERHINLVADMPKDLPILPLDEEKITIALDNLLDNAIKYTPEGGSASITSKREGEYVRTSVTDTGIGIAKSEIKKIFEKFFRAGNAQRYITYGNGLGLYVVKNIVEAHGGRISVESVEGKGTTFTFTLPTKTR